VAIDRAQVFARLLRARRSDASHGIDHSAQLAHAADAGFDVGQAFSHGAGLPSMVERAVLR